MKNDLIVTNNPYVVEKFKDEYEITFLEGVDLIEVMMYVRERIHEGHELKTHPLSGSVKPNETPYKTILISRKKGDLDMSGVSIIEESINTVNKFYSDKKTPLWTEQVLDDFRVIDLSLIENALIKMRHLY